jgi:hypothetical protein
MTRALELRLALRALLDPELCVQLDDRRSMGGAASRRHDPVSALLVNARHS